MKKENYRKLTNIFKKYYNYEHLYSICSWDKDVYMPSQGHIARSNALSDLSELLHNTLVNNEVKDLLSRAEEEELSSLEKIILSEMKKMYERNSVIPAELQKKQTMATTLCSHAWVENRKNNDWKGFLKSFKEVITLTKEEAAIRSTSSHLSPYDSLLELYNSGIQKLEIDNLFQDIKTWLPGLIQKTIEKQKAENFIPVNGHFPVEKQKALSLAIMNKLGLDLSAARLDLSAHPFCGGVPQDVRITTRYDESNFTTGLMGIIHETGHGHYEQNLPRDLLSTPAGMARSTGLHEGQSLLVEMQLGRSKEFLASILPTLKEFLGDHDFLTIENLFKIYTKVNADNLIRVDADELTYPLHVVLRYEIEKLLFEENLSPEDIPELWNQKMKNYLNLDTRGNYKDGPLQDIHWPLGSFGYFPSYTLGSMYAAQEFARAKFLYPQLTSEIEQGDYSSLFNWARENIWEKGSTQTSSEIITNATGEDLNSSFLKEHLFKRYS